MLYPTELRALAGHDKPSGSRGARRAVDEWSLARTRIHELSVLIPTRGRPARLAACVGALARQTLGAERYEVVVGVDGADPDSLGAARQAWEGAGGRAGGLRVVRCRRRGYIDVRHRLIPELRGEIYVSLNDDVEPVPGFLEAHAAAQETRPAIVVGDSRFVAWEDPTLLDRLLDRTGLVFFYHSMDDRDPDRDWGFRHCFGLNFSAPRDLVLAAGGVPSMPRTYGYDDIELAFRLGSQAGGGLRVLYLPKAAAPHRHRYRAPHLLRREQALGVAACRYARVHPEFTAALFGRDILAPEVVTSCRAEVQEQAALAARLRDSFLALDQAPAVDDPGAIHRTYLTHLPLKRHCWRVGFLKELARSAEVAVS